MDGDMSGRPARSEVDYSVMDAEEPLAITAHDLRMSYGAREVIHGISLSVKVGEIFGFLGPNGAGKTTTVELLEGFRKRTGGQVLVLGVDPEKANRHWRAKVGVVLQNSEPELGLTVKETLEMYAGFYEDSMATSEILSLTGLTDAARTRNQLLSGGQQRRLDVALALIGKPDLLFLDEPTTGFDPAARRAAWEIILHLKHLGKTIFLTSHYLDEIEFLADRIVVINDGSIVAEGTPATLGGRDSFPTRISFRMSGNPDLSTLRAALSTSITVERNGSVTLYSQEPLRTVSELYEWVSKGHFTLQELVVRQPTLEDTYLELTRRDKSDADEVSD